MLEVILEFKMNYFLYVFLAGVIDADYRGNVGVVLFNFNDSDFTSKSNSFFVSKFSLSIIYL